MVLHHATLPPLLLSSSPPLLLSAASRTLSLKEIYKSGEDAAYSYFCKLRWAETDGEAVCPVWMAPFLQVLFCDWSFVRCGLVSGLLTRRTLPLALMVSTNQVPFRVSNSKRSGQSTGRLGFRADKFPSLHWSCNLSFLFVVFKRFSLCRVHCGSARPRSFVQFCWPWQPLPVCLACVTGYLQTRGRISPAWS